MVVPIIVLTIYLFSFVFIFQPDIAQVEVFRKNCFIQLHAWLPIMSIWWIAMFMNNYCIEGLKELLKIYSSNRIFFAQKISCVFVYVLYIIVVFVIVNQKLDFGMMTLLQIILETIAIDGIFLIVFFMTKNIGAAMLVVVVYSVYLNFFDIYRYLDVISIFPTWEEEVYAVTKKIYRCMGVFAVSIPFWIIPVKSK